MSAQMHLSNGNNAPRQRELPKPDLRTELPRSDSFESLLSLNMLASSLLDEATDLEELSQDRHITLPHFSTQVIGEQPYTFNNVSSKRSDRGNGVSFSSQDASSSSAKPHEPKRRFGHNRQASTATASSSVPGSQDYDSFLSRSTATHSTKNTSYGSQSAFAKPSGSTSYLPPATVSHAREQATMPDEALSRRSSEEIPKAERPFSSFAVVAGIQDGNDAPQDSASVPRSATSTKIGDWLRQQYENGTRSAHSTPPSASVSSFASPLQPSDDDEHMPSSSTQTSPATAVSEPRQAKVSSSLKRRSIANRTSSQRFRQALLEEIIETDFADMDSPPRPPSRDLLWHPSEYVGPIRRSKTSSGMNRPSNHRRHRSADLLQEPKPAVREDSDTRQPWAANTVGRASMNDLLLRPANDPARQKAEKGIKRKVAFPSRGRRPSQSLSRSFSNLTSFLGFKSTSSSASISPPGISSNGTFVVHNHQHPRTRTPSFVVYSRSPPARDSVKLPDIDVGEELENQALASPISLNNTDSHVSKPGDISQSGGSGSPYQTTLARYRRSLKRLASMKRQPRAEAFQVTERRKAENGRLAELAQEQVARDASVRAQIVDRFTPPIRRDIVTKGD